MTTRHLKPESPALLALLAALVALGPLTVDMYVPAMPQMMVVFVGAPVITGVGLFLLILLAPTMLTVWLEALLRFLDNPFGGR